MIRYLIIDDEYIAHEIIKGYCDLLPNMELKKNCYDAIDAIQYLSTHEVDLIFLDLNMPKLKGFDFLRTLPKPPRVIVTTAYKEYALEGYELNVSDYLLKPFSLERFLKAVNKAISQTAISDSTFIESKIEPTPSQTIFLKGDKKYTQVTLSSILYLEAAGNYTKVFTDTELITTREKISSLLEILPNKSFLQVHKSFIVAKKHIHSIVGNRIFISDREIPIGRMYKLKVDELLRK